MQRISEVKSVHLGVIKTLPPKLLVVAHGVVPTTGWSKPTLEPWFYIQPPPDGIQDFDFTATPPTQFASTVVSPVTAEVVIPRDPADYWGDGKPLAGVRIHGQRNYIEALVSDAGNSGETFLLENGSSPWPWSLGGDQAPTFTSGLIGKRLRVYRTGDILTDDLIVDRINVELSPESGRIVRIWAG